ncbi:MAG TPA: hypothetical protein VF988_13250, partial [Verrucomicrobiae bacterium]
ERFFDINYTALVANPMAMVRKIYRHLDRPLPNLVQEKMRRLIAHRSRYRGRQYPDLELQFETPAQVGWLQKYCRRFGVACQLPQPR